MRGSALRATPSARYLTILVILVIIGCASRAFASCSIDYSAHDFGTLSRPQDPAVVFLAKMIDSHRYSDVNLLDPDASPVTVLDITLGTGLGLSSQANATEAEVKAANERIFSTAPPSFNVICDPDNGHLAFVYANPAWYGDGEDVLAFGVREQPTGKWAIYAAVNRYSAYDKPHWDVVFGQASAEESGSINGAPASKATDKIYAELEYNQGTVVKTAPVGDSIFVNIVGENLRDFYGISLRACWDSSVLQLIGGSLGVARGTLFVEVASGSENDTNQYLKFSKPNVYTKGSRSCAMVSGDRSPLRPVAEADGSVAILQMKVVGPGNADFKIDQTSIRHEAPPDATAKGQGTAYLTAADAP